MLLVCLVKEQCLLHFENLKLYLVSILISILIDLYLITIRGAIRGVAPLQKPCMGVRRDVARLINCLGTAGPLIAFNKVFDCYIRVYLSFSIFIGRAQPTFGWAWALPGPPLAMPLMLIAQAADLSDVINFSGRNKFINRYPTSLLTPIRKFLTFL